MQPRIRRGQDRQLTPESNNEANNPSISQSNYLIQAARTQSALGVLVGIASLALIAVSAGWGWTCWRLGEKRKELRMRLNQIR